jgi:hypothetical protein
MASIGSSISEKTHLRDLPSPGLSLLLQLTHHLVRFQPGCPPLEQSWDGGVGVPDPKGLAIRRIARNL